MNVPRGARIIERRSMRLLLLCGVVAAWHAPHRAPPCSQQRRPVVRMVTDQEARVAAAMEIKPVAEESARAGGLALALDDGTRKSHSMAENTAFVTGFFRGIATTKSFAQLVTSLYFVYVAMEEAFAASDEPSVKSLGMTHARPHMVTSCASLLSTERTRYRLPCAASCRGARGGHGVLPWAGMASQCQAFGCDAQVCRARSASGKRAAASACGPHVHALSWRPVRRAGLSS